MMLGRNKRKQFTLSMKIEILDKVDAGNKKSQVCKEYSLAPSTLSTLIKNKDKLRESFEENSKRKRLRTTEKIDLDTALYNWFKLQRDADIPISGPILQKKATQFGISLGYGNDFKCSMSWISRFKYRHAINCGKMSGETKCINESVTEDWLKSSWAMITAGYKDCGIFNADETGLFYKLALDNCGKVSGEAKCIDEAVTKDWLKNSWPMIKTGYKDCDIFNADETGLFYKLAPDKTLKFKHEKCVGGKLSNDRLTLLVCTNSDGSEKRKLLVIGKANKPKCFKHVKTLPVKYVSNRKAWMTSDIFTREIHEWDKELCRKNRKILLVLDNCAAHPKITNLKNIKLVFLPPHTTSVLQPLHQGIINSLKFHFRKLLVVKLIEDIETNKKQSINILDAIHFVDRAWDNVNQKTINNCFCHAGFIEKLSDCEPENDRFDLKDEISLKQLFARIAANVSFEDYTNVDNMLVTDGDPMEDEIIEQAYEARRPSTSQAQVLDSESSEEEEAIPEISIMEARICLRNVRYFFETRNLQNDKPFSLLYHLENEIDIIASKEWKQKKITDYFSWSGMKN